MNTSLVNSEYKKKKKDRHTQFIISHYYILCEGKVSYESTGRWIRWSIQ